MLWWMSSRRLLTWRAFGASSRSQVCGHRSPFLRLDSKSIILAESGVDWEGGEIKVTFAKFKIVINSNVTEQLTLMDLGIISEYVFSSGKETSCIWNIKLITRVCQHFRTRLDGRSTFTSRYNPAKSSRRWRLLPRAAGETKDGFLSPGWPFEDERSGSRTESWKKWILSGTAPVEIKPVKVHLHETERPMNIHH